MVLEEGASKGDPIGFRDRKKLTVTVHLEDPGVERFVAVTTISGGSFWFQVDHSLYIWGRKGILRWGCLVFELVEAALECLEHYQQLFSGGFWVSHGFVVFVVTWGARGRIRR
jgi:hypothetical protein